MNRGMDDLIKRVKDLPTLPSVVLQVNRVLSDVSVTVDAVSSIIEKDPSLTSRVLRLANSSYYGLSYRVDTITKAITVLGFNTVRNLALAASVFKIFNDDRGGFIDVKELWYHSLGTAIASKSLVNSKDSILREKAFICGIIHDIGKLVIAQNMGGEWKAVMDVCEKGNGTSQSSAEIEVLGFTHADVGSFIAKKWHFPEEYVYAIKLHHGVNGKGPETSKLQDASSISLLYSVFGGNQIAKALSLGGSTDRRVSTMDPKTWEVLGISAENFSEILTRIREDFEEVVQSWNLE